MNRRKFLKTAGMSLAVLAVNPLELIPKRGMLPSKPLYVDNCRVINDCHYYIFQDGSFRIGDKDNYIVGSATGEIKIEGDRYAPA